MSKGYVASGTSNSAAISKTALSFLAATSNYPRLVSLTVGTFTTPADEAGTITLDRITANGTGTTVTPSKMDPAAPASAVTARNNHTAEPTYASTPLLVLPLAQRATYRHVWRPDVAPRVAASASAGVGVKATAFASGAWSPSVILEWTE